MILTKKTINMKKYNRVILGQGSMFAKMCREEGYIGADFGICGT